MKKDIIEHQKNFMNTRITIKARAGKNTVGIQTAIEKAFGEFDRIVKLYSRFNPKSELSILNLQQEKWVRLSEEFFFLIEFALNLALKTDGIFDPTVIDYLEKYGYDKDYNFSKLENKNLQSEIALLSKTRASFKEIALDKKNKKIRLAKNQRVELGGIGKGYAIDCAYKILEKESTRFLIDAGGDIRAKSEDDPWEVALKTSKESLPVNSVFIKNEAIASSGSWARRVKNFHHLLDTKTGKPVERDYSTVFTIAKSAIVADSWATVLFCAGKDFLFKLPKEVVYYFV